MENTRKIAIHLLSHGIMSPAEISWESGASIKLILHWAQLAGINIKARRKNYCAGVWKRHREIPQKQNAEIEFPDSPFNK